MKKNLKIKNESNFGTLLKICVASIISMITIISGVYCFMSGYHNLDMSHNMIVLNEQHNLNLVDINNHFETKPLYYYYIDGLNQVVIGLFISMIGSYLFGYFVCRCLFTYEELYKLRGSKK